MNGHYLYIVHDEKSPSFRADYDKVGPLIHHLEAPETGKSYGNTGISHRKDRTLWKVHVRATPGKLGDLVSQLNGMDSVTLTLSKRELSGQQIEHLASLPLRETLQEE